MAIVNDNITFYEKSCIRSLPNWTFLNSATVSGDSIVIQSGGSAGVEFSNDYFNGLKASKYRKIDAKIHSSANSSFNYKNYIEIVFIGVYKDNAGQRLKLYQSINTPILLFNYFPLVNELLVKRTLNFENYDLDSLSVYVKNHTTHSITLEKCDIYRSQDISDSQVGESIGWGITLREVKAYTDGCEIFYDGVDDPDKLWWMEDEQGNFAGINVNNERMIKFSRTNEPLID